MTKAVYSQDRHCCCDDDKEVSLSLELVNGGGGEYLVLHASEWAFDDKKEIDEFVKLLHGLMAKARKDDNSN